MGAGIVPVAVHKGTIYFLFGKEYEDNKWSDFGGGREKNETLWNVAMREGTEELNGFLGTQSELKKQVKQHLITIIESEKPIYRSYFFKVPYDANLPQYFNSNFKLMKKKLPDQIMQDGLFEKSEIRWISIDQLNTIKYRDHYNERIITRLLTQLPDIKNKLL